MMNSLLRMPTDTNPYCVNPHMNQKEKKKGLEKAFRKIYFMSQKQTLIKLFQVSTYLSILRPLHMPVDIALELQVGRCH